jgi:hypothetical protein
MPAKTPLAAALSLSLAVAPALAQNDETNPDYFKIDRNSVELIESERTTEPAPEPGYKPHAVPEALIIFNILVNLGDKAWKMIKGSKEVAHGVGNARPPFASATPKGIEDWAQLTGWKPVETRTFHLRAKNLLGIQVVDVKYQLRWMHGGSHKGKGRYVANATAVPVETKILPGFHFDMNVAFGNPYNAGTDDAPVGAIEAQISWKIKSLLKEEGSRGFYTIRGDGGFDGGKLGKKSVDKKKVVKLLDASKILSQGFSIPTTGD